MKLLLNQTDIKARIAHSLMTSAEIPWMKELEKQSKNVFIELRKNSSGKIEAVVEIRDYDWNKHEENKVDNSSNNEYLEYKPYSWK